MCVCQGMPNDEHKAISIATKDLPLLGAPYISITESFSMMSSIIHSGSGILVIKSEIFLNTNEGFLGFDIDVDMYSLNESLS